LKPEKSQASNLFKTKKSEFTFRPALNSSRLLTMNKPTEKEAWKEQKHLG